MGRKTIIDPSINLWTIVCLIGGGATAYYRLSQVEARVEKTEKMLVDFREKTEPRLTIVETEFNLHKQIKHTP